MIHIGAPTLVIRECARLITPANIAVICIIRNTENVIPKSRAVNFALSLTSSLNPMLNMPLYFIALPDLR